MKSSQWARTPSPALLSAAEAARFLGTTERHLRRLREVHGLAAVHLGGKVRFRVEDLEAFIERNQTGRAPGP